MVIAWHPQRQWNFWMSEVEGEKKKQNQFLLSNAFNVSVVYNVEVPRQFVTQKLDIVQKSLSISCYFDTTNYT